VRPVASDADLVDLIVSVVEPDFDALSFEKSEAFEIAIAFVLGSPEAGTGGVDFVDDGLVELFEGDDFRVQLISAFFFSRVFKDVKVVAAELIENDNVIQAFAKTVEKFLQEIDRVFSGIHDVPVGQGETLIAGEFQDAGFVHPFDEGFVGLGGKVDKDARAGIFSGSFDDGVEAFIFVHHDGGGVVRIKPEERAVGAIGIKPEEGNIGIDQILSNDAGDDGLADAAFFAADEMNVSHVI